MAATVTPITAEFAVTEVGDVVVTPVVQDGGVYVREIRIFGLPAGEGNIAPRLAVLRITGATAAALAVTAPSSEF